MRVLQATTIILILEIRLQVHKKFDGGKEEATAYEKTE